jgi:hypothetical protein
LYAAQAKKGEEFIKKITGLSPEELKSCLKED